MPRAAFLFQDISRECDVETDVYRLDGRALGIKISVPEALRQQYPYNASAYVFLQQLRELIFDCGVVEFPELPVNPCNHTVAMRSPREHGYSSNPYLTDSCQQPHQDTPPYPTAFWLGEERKYFATWVMSKEGLRCYTDFCRAHPQMTELQYHRHLVPESLNHQQGLLLNYSAGLLLVDNSQHHALYHGRSCRFDAIEARPDYQSDTPMYAYNEVGLVHYIDTLDSRRGRHDRDAAEVERVKAFMAAEGLL